MNTPAQNGDPASMLLALRDDVVLLPQRHGKELFYYLESKEKGNFFRIGYAEYVFISLLDGRTRFSEALALTARALGANALSQTQAKEVCAWLIEHRLVVTEKSDDFLSIDKQTNRWWKQFNPLWIKLSFGSPDAFVAAITDACGFLFRPAIFIACCCLIISTILLVIQQYDAFIHALSFVIVPNNWLRLAVIWVVLKCLHELGHAVACKRFGGEVRDCGLVFVLFAPLAYVDVTSAWRFSQRSQRVAVAAAGVFVELVVASVAAILWLSNKSTSLEPWLCNIFVSATVTTVLFNINPLMRFDGYFILADWLMVPNLYGRAKQHANAFLKRIFWGECRIEAKLAGHSRTIMTAYGILCMFWRTVMTLSMVLAASLLFSGAGFYISVLAVLLWIAKPLWAFMQDIRRRIVETPHTIIRGGVIFGTVMIVGVSGLAVIPWPGEIVAPGIIEFSDECIVRAEVNGFIKKIYVSDGQKVKSGQILFELENPQLNYQLAEIAERIEAEAASLRLALEEKRTGNAQISKRNLEAFELRRGEILKDLDRLRVVATTSGKVIARDLPRKLDRYVIRGAELLIIEDPSHKEIMVVLDTEQARALEQTPVQDVRFQVGPEQAFRGRLLQIQPRATTRIPHEALSAKAGGPLAIKATTAENDRSGEELVEPRVIATIALPSEASAVALSGQRGYAHLGTYHRTVIERWWHPFINLIERQLKTKA